jgi:hypothetical protein
MRIAIADTRKLAGAGNMDGHCPIMVLRVDRHAAGTDEFRLTYTRSSPFARNCVRSRDSRTVAGSPSVRSSQRPAA